MFLIDLWCIKWKIRLCTFKPKIELRKKEKSKDSFFALKMATCIMEILFLNKHGVGDNWTVSAMLLFISKWTTRRRKGYPGNSSSTAEQRLKGIHKVREKKVAAEIKSNGRLMLQQGVMWIYVDIFFHLSSIVTFNTSWRKFDKK